MGRKVRTPSLTELESGLSLEERVRRLRRASLILVGIARRVDALPAGDGRDSIAPTALLMGSDTAEREEPSEEPTYDTPEARAA